MLIFTLSISAHESFIDSYYVNKWNKKFGLSDESQVWVYGINLEVTRNREFNDKISHILKQKIVC